MKKQTQMLKTLELFRKFKVINSHDLTYVYGIKQGPSRVSDLEDLGYLFKHHPFQKNRSRDYEFLSEPNIQPEELVRKPIDYRIEGNRAIPIYE